MRLPWNFEKIPAQERLAARESQIANSGLAHFVDQSDGARGIHRIFPPRLPMMTADALGLAVFGELDVRGQRTDLRRQEFLRNLAFHPDLRQEHAFSEHPKVS